MDDHPYIVIMPGPEGGSLEHMAKRWDIYSRHSQWLKKNCAGSYRIAGVPKSFANMFLFELESDAVMYRLVAEGL